MAGAPNIVKTINGTESADSRLLPPRVIMARSTGAISSTAPATKSQCAWLALRPLWETAPTPWFVYSGDGRLAYTNTAIERLFGTKAPPPTSTAFPCVVPESRAAYERLLARLRREPPKGATRATLMIDSREGRVVVTAHLIAVPDATASGNAVIGRLEMVAPSSPSLNNGAATRRLHELEQELMRLVTELAALHNGHGVEDVELVDALSPRQRQILDHLIAGQRPSTIAESLHLSIHTVRNHAKAILRKAGVHSQAELIARARPKDVGVHR